MKQWEMVGKVRETLRTCKLIPVEGEFNKFVLI